MSRRTWLTGGAVAAGAAVIEATVAPRSIAAADTGSTVNWSSAGQTVANGSFSTLDDDRNLRVFVGGGGSATHFTIDITGYTL